MDGPDDLPPNSGQAPALNDRQQALLQRIYDHFQASALWPRYRQLEIDLWNQAPLHEIISGIPGSLIVVETPIQRGTTCSLTLRGIAHCEGSQDDVENFVRAVALLASQYVQHGEDVKVHSDLIASELGLSEIQCRRVVELLWREGGTLIGGGSRSNDGASSELNIGPSALHFVGTSSLEDFFDRVKKAEEARRSESSFGRSRGWYDAGAPERIVPTPPQGFVIEDWSLHPAVVNASSSLFISEHYAEAVRTALQVFEHHVQRLCSLPDVFGKDLMAKAFNEKNPLIRINPLVSLTDRNDQEGFKFLAMGIMVGLRNTYSHGEPKKPSASEALEQLTFLSILFRRLEINTNPQKEVGEPSASM